MYTRTYQAEEEKITVPENYDGNAFREEQECEYFTASDINTQQSTKSDSNCEIMQENASAECVAVPEKKSGGDGKFASIFKGSGGIKSTLLESLPFVKNGKFDIGTEEILILAVAVFLLLSKSGDKECAIMLFLLLFVK